MRILRSVTGTLWLGFVPIILLGKGTVAQNQKEITIDCTKPLDFQIRQFKPGSRENKLRSELKYSQKPLWPLQWQMTEEILEVDGRSYVPSMKIAEMHNIGIKGKGVRVVIIANTPVNCLHTSIRSRCHVDESTTTLSKTTGKSLSTILKEMLIKHASNSISSEVAGIIGMNDSSGTGGVGIAPECHIGYVIMNRYDKNGLPEYCAMRSISRNLNPPAEVFVHSWNIPEHDYRIRVLHASDLSLLNFNNLQTILKPHVMGSGMYGMIANSCQCNEYANADSMFVFGGVTYGGYLIPTSESCASLFGVTYSTSHGHYFYNNIVTINSIHSSPFNCASKSETAVSAAVAGGIIALIIDCFKRKFGKPPSVSDLAFLLAFSLSSKTLQDTNILWFSNGAGLMYSQQAGFGLPDMRNVMVLLAIWTPMDSPLIYEATPFTKEIEFRCKCDKGRRTSTYASNLKCHFSITNALARLRIQLVSVELSAELVKRGALTSYLISPAGTVSCILEGRPYDTARKYNKLLLRSNHFIGEQLGGQWSLRFYTYQEDSKPTGGEQPLKSDSKPSNPEGNNQLPRKKRVTFKEEVTFLDETSVVDKVKSGHPTEPQKLRGILREPKTGPSITESLPSQAKPVETKKREPNIVNLNEIKLRFVLHVSLPGKLNLEPRVKSVDERNKNFELLKAWVDFRHYLFAQLDPQKGSKIRLENQNIYSIQSRYVKKLAALQKEGVTKSVPH